MSPAAATASAAEVERLRSLLDEALGGTRPTEVAPMAGGGSCEAFAVQHGDRLLVLRRAPRHASSATAHDVLREFRILDAIKDERVPLARPLLACDDPEVFGSPFFLMEHVDGAPLLTHVPEAWAAAPHTHGRALEELVDALVAVHAVDWQACGLGHLPHHDDFLTRQRRRWLDQLASYGGRDLPAAHQVADWLDAHQPPDQPPALCHGDYKLDNVLFAPGPPPRLLAVLDWEMAAIGDPLVDLAWAMVFHPGPEGTIPLATSKPPTIDQGSLPGRQDLVDRYAARSGRDTSAMGWYHVFARWKLAIVLEGSYTKFLQGRSDKPLHELFGHQADVLLADALQTVQQEVEP